MWQDKQKQDWFGQPCFCYVHRNLLIDRLQVIHEDAVMICTTINAQEVVGMPHVQYAVPDFTHLDLPTLLGHFTNR